MHDASYYRNLGFKCGLEIHQRLATSEKLFCSCSANFANDKATDKVSRRQRAVAGELGLVDRSTSFESSRHREFVYNVFKKTSCLVDIDEEPPHKVNPEAIETAIRFATAFNANVPDEIEPMRKQVVDGSDPSAFQRSMMVAYDGSIEVKGINVPITSMFLEEESSGIESNTLEHVVYNIDRIGIPLIEIDTDPSITTPQQARDVALKIGLILRLTGKSEGSAVKSGVQRGIGTIRQDVNVSIEGGTRVEIKGLQEIDTVDVVIENEVERQVKLLDIKKQLLSRKASVGKPKDLGKQLHDTDAKILKDAISSKGTVIGAALKGFGGLLGMEINPERRLGSEISDYAKMAGVKGIIHSDENLDKYGIRPDELSKIKKELGALSEGDSFILIAAEKEMCERAMEFALGRAAMALSEVPPETRAVLDSKKGTTRFMRPLPGGSRMYPETDSECIEVPKKTLEKISASTIYVDQRIANIRNEIPNAQLAEQMVYSPKLPLYEYLVSQTSGINLVIATTILEKLKELERAGVNTDIDKDVLLQIFRLYQEGKITKAAIGEILRHSPKSEMEVRSIITSNALEKMTEEKLMSMIKKIGKKDRGEIMREIMSQYRLNVDGEELNRILGSMQ